MSSSYNQSIADASSENRPPMIEKGSYLPWAARFMRYIDGKKDYGHMLKDSINKSLYQTHMMTDPMNLTGDPIVEPHERMQIDTYLTSDEKTRFEACIDAMNAIFLGIPNDIYNFVDACKTMQAM
ncbi:hypothetical protein Tco_0403427 [Tanacetum coccineum]